QADGLDPLGLHLVERPNAFGLGGKLLADRAQTLLPVPLVGFELPLFIVVEIERELGILVLARGFGHALLLLLQDLPHGRGLLIGTLGQIDASLLGKLCSPPVEMWP